MPKGYPRTHNSLDADVIETPTTAEIARWKSGLEKIHARIKALSATADQYVALIAAAETMVPITPAAAPKAQKESRITPPPKAKSGRRKSVRKVQLRASKKPAPAPPPAPATRQKAATSGTWTAVIQEILADAGRGLVHSELRNEIAKTHLGERLATSDKGFYGGIAKLADRNPPLLVKYKGRLFDPAIYQQFVNDLAAGRVQDLEEIQHVGQGSPFGDAILDVLKANTFGLTSAEIIEMLKKDATFAPTVERHPTHAYNVLARLIKNGELTKWNEKYFLGPKARTSGS